MPFSIESYIKKAKKNGYTTAQIKAALTADGLWNKVINEGKPFKKVFEYYLESAKDGNLKPTPPRDPKMKTVYSQYKGRLI